MGRCRGGTEEWKGGVMGGREDRGRKHVGVGVAKRKRNGDRVDRVTKGMSDIKM